VDSLRRERREYREISHKKAQKNTKKFSHEESQKTEKFLVLGGWDCGYNLTGDFEAKRKLVPAEGGQALR